jgi:hypothetical protein
MAFTPLSCRVGKCILFDLSDTEIHLLFLKSKLYQTAFFSFSKAEAGLYILFQTVATPVVGSFIDQQVGQINYYFVIKQSH